MNPMTESLLTAVLALPEAERVDFVEALLASLQSEDRPAFDECWREIIRRRSAELRSGQVEPILWAEVKRQAREKAGG